MVVLGRHPRWASFLAVLTTGIALGCVIIDLVVGTGGWLIGLVLAVLGVGLVILGSLDETNRRRLVGLWISVFAYIGLVLGFVLAITGLAIAGSSVSEAQRQIPAGFDRFVYQFGNGVGGLFILLGLLAAAYTGWAYVTTRGGRAASCPTLKMPPVCFVNAPSPYR